jgi:hypothetical protein
MRFIILGIGAVLMGLVGVWFFFNGPGFDGPVASLKLADGSEYLVTQNWHSWSEPYAVHFYMKEPGGKWGWCYLDHESSRWRNAELSYDDGSATLRVMEGGKLMATLDRRRHIFTLGGQGGSDPSERQAPQTELDRSPL